MNFSRFAAFVGSPANARLRNRRQCAAVEPGAEPIRGGLTLGAAVGWFQDHAGFGVRLQKKGRR